MTDQEIRDALDLDNFQEAKGYIDAWYSNARTAQASARRRSTWTRPNACSALIAAATCSPLTAICCP